MNLSSAGITELEAKEAMALEVRDIHLSSWESCVKPKDFRVLNVRRDYGGSSCELRSSRRLRGQIGACLRV